MKQTKVGAAGSAGQAEGACAKLCVGGSLDSEESE